MFPFFKTQISVSTFPAHLIFTACFLVLHCCTYTPAAAAVLALLLLLYWIPVRTACSRCNSNPPASCKQSAIDDCDINTTNSTTYHTLLAQDRKSVKHFSRGPRARRLFRAARTDPMGKRFCSYTVEASSVLGARGRQRGVHDTPSSSYPIPHFFACSSSTHDLRYFLPFYYAAYVRDGQDPPFNSIGGHWWMRCQKSYFT